MNQISPKAEIEKSQNLETSEQKDESGKTGSVQTCGSCDHTFSETNQPMDQKHFPLSIYSCLSEQLLVGGADIIIPALNKTFKSKKTTDLWPSFLRMPTGGLLIDSDCFLVVTDQNDERWHVKEHPRRWRMAPTDQINGSDNRR